MKEQLPVLKKGCNFFYVFGNIIEYIEETFKSVKELFDIMKKITMVLIKTEETDYKKISDIHINPKVEAHQGSN